MVDQLGVRDKERAWSSGRRSSSTRRNDPARYGDNMKVGRSPEETLRILDGLQTDELCPCNRDVGGEVLKAA